MPFFSPIVPRIFSQHPMVNDDLPNRIIAGTVLVKCNVSKFTETDAIFDDETVEKNIDAVIFATGYSFSFPFCKDIKVENNKVSLYKYTFLPELEKQTLAVIGLIQPLGAIMPISELQCRLAARAFTGKYPYTVFKDLSGRIKHNYIQC